MLFEERININNTIGVLRGKWAKRFWNGQISSRGCNKCTSHHAVTTSSCPILLSLLSHSTSYHNPSYVVTAGTQARPTQTHKHAYTWKKPCWFLLFWPQSQYQADLAETRLSKRCTLQRWGEQNPPNNRKQVTYHDYKEGLELKSRKKNRKVQTTGACKPIILLRLHASTQQVTYFAVWHCQSSQIHVHTHMHALTKFRFKQVASHMLTPINTAMFQSQLNLR